VYDNGVLRPLQPLDLKAHEHVLVSIVAVAGPKPVKLGCRLHRNDQKGTEGL